MTTAPGLGGRDRITEWRKHPTAIVCAVLIGVLLLVLALPSPWGFGAFETRQTGGVLGPYTLDATNYYAPIEISFPQCAFVVAHWAVVTGGPTNFSAGSGEFVADSDCHGPPPSNQSCLPSGCSSMGPPPICYEVGMGGSCSFTATQSQYYFDIFQASGPVPANESAAVTIDYS